MIRLELKNVDTARVADYPRLATVWGYYAELTSRLGRVPTRRDLDPVGFYAALPSACLVEVHRDVGRLRFRLVGQEVLNRVGSIGMSGRWLDQLINTDFGDMLEVLFGNLHSIEEPIFETGEVQRRATRSGAAFVKLAVPLAACEGEPEAALVVVVFFDTPDRLGR